MYHPFYKDLKEECQDNGIILSDLAVLLRKTKVPITLPPQETVNRFFKTDNKRRMYPENLVLKAITKEILHLSDYESIFLHTKKILEETNSKADLATAPDEDVDKCIDVLLRSGAYTTLGELYNGTEFKTRIVNGMAKRLLECGLIRHPLESEKVQIFIKKIMADQELTATNPDYFDMRIRHGAITDKLAAKAVERQDILREHIHFQGKWNGVIGIRKAEILKKNIEKIRFEKAIQLKEVHPDLSDEETGKMAEESLQIKELKNELGKLERNVKENTIPNSNKDNTREPVDEKKYLEFKKEKRALMARIHPDGSSFRNASREGKIIKEEIFKELSQVAPLEAEFNTVFLLTFYEIRDRYYTLMRDLGEAEKDDDFDGSSVEEKIEAIKKAIQRMDFQIHNTDAEIKVFFHEIEQYRSDLDNPDLVPSYEKCLKKLGEEIEALKKDFENRKNVEKSHV